MSLRTPIQCKIVREPGLVSAVRGIEPCMRGRVLLVIVTVVVVGLAVGIGLVFPTTASAMVLDRNAFTFVHYDLNVRVEPEQERFGVRGTLILRNDSLTPQKVAVLQISSTLEWRGIQCEGKPLLYSAVSYPSDIDHTGTVNQAVVNLPHEVPPHGTVELKFAYEGTIPRDATRLTRIGVPGALAVRSDWDHLDHHGGAVRGLGYTVWYPVALEAVSLSDGNSVFSAIGDWRTRHSAATMRVEFTLITAADSHYEVVCNAPGSGGTGVCEYAALDAVIPAFAIAEYELASKPSSLVHYFPEDSGAAALLASTLETLAPVVKDLLPGAGRKVELVELSDPGAAPWESGAMLFTPMGSQTAQAHDEQLVHSLSHAAFDSRRPWLAEGVAGLVQLLWREHVGQRKTAPAELAQRFASLGEAEKAAVAEKGAPLVRTQDEALVRIKSLAVFSQLRDMVGEDKLVAALRQYRAADDKDPGYLQTLIGAQSKRDLEWFFDDWVYRERGLPDFRVDVANTRSTLNGTYIVVVSVENIGDAGAEVPVIVRTAQGDMQHRLEVRAKSKAIVRIEVPQPPVEVVINDGSVPESDITNNRAALSLAK